VCADVFKTVNWWVKPKQKYTEEALPLSATSETTKVLIITSKYRTDAFVG
jgi:hypothetical protein